MTRHWSIVIAAVIGGGHNFVDNPTRNSENAQNTHANIDPLCHTTPTHWHIRTPFLCWNLHCWCNGAPDTPINSRTKPKQHKSSVSMCREKQIHTHALITNCLIAKQPHSYPMQPLRSFAIIGKSRSNSVRPDTHACDVVLVGGSVRMRVKSRCASLFVTSSYLHPGEALLWLLQRSPECDVPFRIVEGWSE